MAGRYNGHFGNSVANASVSVYNTGTKTLATLYTDKTAATTASNPGLLRVRRD